MIAVLLIVGSIVIVGYTVLVGSRSFWFHAIGAGAVALILGLSLVALLGPDVSVLGRSIRQLGAVPDRGSHAVLRAVEVDAPVEMLAAAYDRQR